MFAIAIGLAIVQELAFAMSRVHGPIGVVVTLFGMSFLILTIGFRGVERVWFDSIGRGDRMSLADLRAVNREMRGRFLVLGLVFAVPAVAVFTPLKHASKPIHFAGVGVFVWIVDGLLTFVTVQLSLVTRSVREALGAGLKLLRDQWPRCAAYVLIPPMGVQAVIQFVAGFGVASRFIGAMLVMPIAFVCRGATVRFYDRECRVLPVHSGIGREVR